MTANRLIRWEEPEGARRVRSKDINDPIGVSRVQLVEKNLKNTTIFVILVFFFCMGGGLTPELLSCNRDLLKTSEAGPPLIGSVTLPGGQ